MTDDCGCTLGQEGADDAPQHAFCPMHAAAADLFNALRSARLKWGRLHGIVSSLIEEGKITEAMLPDDYQVLVYALRSGATAEAVAMAALNKARPPKNREPDWFA